MDRKTEVLQKRVVERRVGSHQSDTSSMLLLQNTSPSENPPREASVADIRYLLLACIKRGFLLISHVPHRGNCGSLLTCNFLHTRRNSLVIGAEEVGIDCLTIRERDSPRTYLSTQ